jgi:hypothetical protein
VQRGLHEIDDELIFESHAGYVFHDSRGFEAGAEEELKIVQEFVRRRSQEERLNDRLHAIWFVSSGTSACEFTRLLFRYCIPMDKDRPSLDLKHFGDVCPDNNGRSICGLYELRFTSRIFQVPVIAVFTKFDQFRREVRMKLEDQHRDPEMDLDVEMESIFNQHYLGSLRGPPPFIRLESENFVHQLNVYGANILSCKECTSLANVVRVSST